MGCSVIKNRKSKNDNISIEIVNENVLEYAKNQNITTNGFYIQKADIEIYTSEGREKVLGSLKFENPDKYLISIKSRSGIEAARIFISNDTILINDRINKKLYVGSPKYLKIKYGIPASVLPVVFGDVISDKYSYDGKTDCSEGKLNVSVILEGVKINYVIDCKKSKSISAVTENSLNKDRIKIEYDDFKKNGNKMIPARIDIKDSQSKTTIEIKILKIESPWNGNMDFIPGNKYEVLQLL